MSFFVSWGNLFDTSLGKAVLIANQVKTEDYMIHPFWRWTQVMYGYE